MDCLLLLLALLYSSVWARASEAMDIDNIYGEAAVEKKSFDRMDQHVLLECKNAADLVRCATWTRDGALVHNSSRMTINENGTITVAPALPEDEGVYRCGPDEESLGETFNFAVSPHVQKRTQQIFGHLGSNFSIPCPIEIGPISRQQGFSVLWIQRAEEIFLLNLLIHYEGNASEANTNLIPSTFDPSHVFNVSDLSLLVYDFSVPDLNQKEISYTCRIGTSDEQQASATIIVTISKDHVTNIQIPQITNLKLTCEELILSFELPQHFLSTAVNLQLQTKVRFIEILPFGVSDSESRVVNATYEVASTLDCPSNAEGCTVDIDLRGRLPNEVEEFDRYRAEALLLVNGTEGHQFSPSTMSVLRDCDASLEQDMLTLDVEFIGESGCSTVGSQSISEAVKNAIQDRCSFNCDDLIFGTPHLICSPDNRNGLFTVEVTAFEAKAVVADFHSIEPVIIMNGAAHISIRCSTCGPNSGAEDVTRYAITGPVVVITVVILFVLVLIFVVAKRRKKKLLTFRTKREDPERPANIELEPVQHVRTCIFDPDRPPRSPISLTLPAAIHSRTEQHHTLNVPDPPLSEHQMPPHPHSTDPSSQQSLQLHEVHARELEGRNSPTSYQGSEASSPRHTNTAYVREVSPVRCNCHCGYSPVFPLLSGILADQLQPQAIFQRYTVPCNRCACAHKQTRPEDSGYVEHVLKTSLPSPKSHEVVTLPRAQLQDEDNLLCLYPSTASLSKGDTSRMSPARITMNPQASRYCLSPNNPPTIPESASPSLLGCTHKNESERLETLEVELKCPHVHFQGCKTQPKARHSLILNGNIYVNDSHFNQPPDGNNTTSADAFSSIDYDTIKYGSGGGMYINRIHDITIKIPEKAIPEGTVLQLSISAMLYGPFLFPEGVRPVSPILWLCTDPTLTFSKPIEVVLPHYLHCESQKDTEKLIFLKANHNSPCGKFHFKPADGESVFMHHTSYGTLHTKHCCFLCIAAKKTEKDTLNANLALITAYPRNPLEHPWNVCFGVTYLLPTCIQSFRNQFKDDYKILRARKFRMQDTAERKIEICYPENLPQHWLAGLNGSNQILASDVDFWSIWNRDPTELKVMEQEKMYPPNFDVIIDGRSAVGDSRLTASFSGIDCPLKVEIPLLLPPSTQHEMPKEEVCQDCIKRKVSNRTSEQDDTIELRELCLELHTVDGWFQLGVYLGISHSELKVIEVQYHDPHRCRMEMLQVWLNNFNPSWSAVIEALKLLKMCKLAERVAAKKAAYFPPSHVNVHLQRNSPTPPQVNPTHQPVQRRGRSTICSTKTTEV